MAGTPAPLSCHRSDEGERAGPWALAVEGKSRTPIKCVLCKLGRMLHSRLMLGNPGNGMGKEGFWGRRSLLPFHPLFSNSTDCLELGRRTPLAPRPSPLAPRHLQQQKQRCDVRWAHAGLTLSSRFLDSFGQGGRTARLQGGRLDDMRLDSLHRDREQRG